MTWAAVAIGGASLVGGYMSAQSSSKNAKLAANTQLAQAQMMATEAYPGQKSIAKALAPFLWENLNQGLTEDEKLQYRGEGKTSILQGAKSGEKAITNIAASQGLKGGAITRAISGVREGTIPQFAKLEGDIRGLDVNLKRKSISDILQFLSLATHEGEGADLADLDLAKVQTKEQNMKFRDMLAELLDEKMEGFTKTNDDPYGLGSGAVGSMGDGFGGDGGDF